MLCGSSKVHVVRLAAVPLVVLIAVAGYALYHLEALSLPIPAAVAAITVLVPFLAAAIIQRAIAAARGVGPRPAWLGTLVFSLSVLETVLATIAGTRLLPVSELQCGLDSQWRSLFQAASGHAIRGIQNALDCCGLHALDDMAWPFSGNDTCQSQTGRTKSCFMAWRKEEQKVAFLMVLVLVMAFAWKIIGLMLVPARVGGIRWESTDRGSEAEYRDQPANYGRGIRSVHHSRQTHRSQLVSGGHANYGATDSAQGDGTQGYGTQGRNAPSESPRDSA